MQALVHIMCPYNNTGPKLALYMQVALIRAGGLVLKGAFSKGKGTFWKNRLYSKLIVSFAEDGCFLLGSK